MSPVSAGNEKLLEDRIDNLEKRVRFVEDKLAQVEAALAAKDAALATKKNAAPLKAAPSKAATGSRPKAVQSPAGQQYVKNVRFPPLPPPRRSPSVHIDICICAGERRVYRRDRVDIFRQHAGDRRRFAGAWCRRMQV